ncbi:MAG: SGNH/GDSL hydrolase family protein [Propionibacteriaceae bacterium]|jgi:lysophospholipase L1-like esterase|nr:SGNH/GDSL hydrolase family protein [Propionibacteriaceae bacterium]
MKTVMVFGDSNSWGWDPTNRLDGQKLRRHPDDVRWPGVMAALLGSDYKVLVDGLNGRTTVWDDPIEEYRCGKDQIVPSLDAQAPFDLVVIMVGTNDLKARYTVTAQDIANGAGLLVDKALHACAGDYVGDPAVLLICPPALGEAIETDIFELMFAGGLAKSRQFPTHFKAVAESYGVHYFDAGTVVKCSRHDGLHLDPDQHALLGQALAEQVKAILG